MSFWEGASDIYYRIWGGILTSGAALIIGDILLTRGRPRLVPHAQRHTPKPIFSGLSLVLGVALGTAGIGLFIRARWLVTWSFWCAGGILAILGMAALLYGSKPERDTDW